MILLKDIKRKRDKQRKKIPVRKRLFNQISAIVKNHRLSDKFLEILDNTESYLCENKSDHKRIKVKTPLKGPLFPLITKEEFSITMSIIRKIDNPYLKFAHSPEEIIWCGPLYHLNPSMGSDKLMRYHFETLYLYENVKEKMRKLKLEDTND